MSKLHRRLFQIGYRLTGVGLLVQTCLIGARLFSIRAQSKDTLSSAEFAIVVPALVMMIAFDALFAVEGVLVGTAKKMFGKDPSFADWLILGIFVTVASCIGLWYLLMQYS